MILYNSRKQTFLLITIIITLILLLSGCSGDSQKYRIGFDKYSKENTTAQEEKEAEQEKNEQSVETNSEEEVSKTDTKLDIDKITLATGEYQPYSSESMDGYGFVSEVLTAAFGEVGIEPEFVFYPWNRCEKVITDGKIYATFPYVQNEPRKKKYNFSDYSVSSTRFLFFYHKSNDKIKSGFSYDELTDLLPYKIALLEGYFTTEILKNAGLESTFDKTVDEVSALRKLIAGRVDFVPLNELVGRQLIKKHFPEEADNFLTLDKALVEDKHYLMISQTYPNAEKITEVFNKGLKTIKENGVYDEILAKYGVANK